ncbi:MAG: circadian clock KaiB family protein [Bacteroidota bacterium]
MNTHCYGLKLFISTYATSSQRAVSNLNRILEEHLKGRYKLAVIDVRKQPEIVLAENITALPLLIRNTPSPTRRLVGDMSDTVRVLRGLECIV